MITQGVFIKENGFTKCKLFVSNRAIIIKSLRLDTNKPLC